MRFLILVAVLLACLLGVAWIGGEAWLAKRSRLVIQQTPQIEAQDVTPLRELHRIGMRIDQPKVQAQGDLEQLDLPWLDVWVAPTALTTANVTLPDSAVLHLAGAELPISMQGAGLRARIAPLHEFVLSQAGMQADSLSLGDQLLAEGAFVDMQLVSLGAQAPLDARSAYDVTVGLGRGTGDLLTLFAPQLAGSDLSVGASGQARVYLDGSLYRDVLTGAVPPPHVIGLQSDGVALNLNQGQIVLSADLSPDAEGLVQGELRISGNAQAIVEGLRLAVLLGYLPDRVLQVGTSVASGIAIAEAGLAARAAEAQVATNNLAAAPAPTDADTDADADADAGAPAPAGTSGLTIRFEDGAMMIGNIRVGTAPSWRG